MKKRRARRASISPSSSVSSPQNFKAAVGKMHPTAFEYCTAGGMLRPIRVYCCSCTICMRQLVIKVRAVEIVKRPKICLARPLNLLDSSEGDGRRRTLNISFLRPTIQKDVQTSISRGKREIGPSSRGAMARVWSSFRLQNSRHNEEGERYSLLSSPPSTIKFFQMEGLRCRTGGWDEFHLFHRNRPSSVEGNW